MFDFSQTGVENGIPLPKHSQKLPAPGMKNAGSKQDPRDSLPWIHVQAHAAKAVSDPKHPHLWDCSKPGFLSRLFQKGRSLFKKNLRLKLLSCPTLRQDLRKTGILHHPHLPIPTPSPHFGPNQRSLRDSHHLQGLKVTGLGEPPRQTSKQSVFWDLVSSFLFPCFCKNNFAYLSVEAVDLNSLSHSHGKALSLSSVSANTLVCLSSSPSAQQWHASCMSRPRIFWARQLSIPP